MQLEEVLRRRRMTRRFLDEPLDASLLDRLLDAARRVPSAGYTQAVELVALTEPASRRRFWSAVADPSWLDDDAGRALSAAPAILLPVVSAERYRERYAAADKGASWLATAGEWPVPYWLVDASFSVLALLLAAEDAGLGALFFHLQGKERAVLAALGVPESYESVGAVAIGRRAPEEEPSGSATRRGRRPLAELVHREGW